jgi:glutamine amidotransferase
MKVVILDYGAGNTQSVLYALKRCGITPIITNNQALIKTADAVIFPGVGHATQAKAELIKTQLWDLIPTLKQPVLGVCLGMQLLANSTEEGDIAGLGIIDTQVVRFTEELVKVPHMGWNEVELTTENPLFAGIATNEFGYFVHSYYMKNCKQTIATASYQQSITAAVQQHNFFGCQFHPEKSGAFGDQILTNFLTLAASWK